MKTFKTILHPNDLSQQSSRALETAYSLAQDYGARLILLYVQEPQETIQGEFGMPPPEPEPDDESIRAEMRNLLPKDSSVQAECLVGHGNVMEVILQTAKETQCDLIVLASHGPRNALVHWWHANVAEHVANEAPCEVMVVDQVGAEKALAV